MRPQTIYEVPISKVNKLERLVSSYAKKCLGLSRCFSSIGLYGKSILELLVSSLVEEFKYTKIRLEITLNESCDPCVAQKALTLVTGRKWTPEAATQQATSVFLHWEIVGNMQQVRGGLGHGDSRPSWHKATPAQCRGLVVEKVRHQEQAIGCAK